MKAPAWIAAAILPLTLSTAIVLFDRTFGGVESDFANGILQTPDGGFLVVGQTESFGNGSAHSPDVWIIRIDATGAKQWDRTFGTAGYADNGACISPTADAGFIIAGTTWSFGSHYPAMWILKLNADGDTAWSRVFEQSIASLAYSIRQTADGGYIMSGKGKENILKLDDSGRKQWGVHAGFVMSSVTQTADGGYIAAGDSILVQREWDYIPSLSLVRLDENGGVLWSNPFGDGWPGKANTVIQTADGGCVVAGDSIALQSASDFTRFFMVAKLDGQGNRSWKYIGGVSASAQSVCRTADGGLLVAGNIVDSAYGLDVLLVRLDADGNERWSRRYGKSGGWEYPASVLQTADGGCVVAGQTDSFGAGRYDIWLLKLDENGNGPGPVGVEDGGSCHDSGWSLSQSYPNPCARSTSFDFALPGDHDVTLRIFTINGRHVKTLLDGKPGPGRHCARWDGTDDTNTPVAPGVYYAVMHARGATVSRAIMLLGD